jgi:hypothetical protein
VLDVADDVNNDITSRPRQSSIESLIVNDLIFVVGIDLVCGTWSSARTAPSPDVSPVSLRGGGRFLYSMPNLNFKQQQQVVEGDIMYRHAVDLIKLCILSKVRGYLENPLASKLWHPRGMRFWIQSKLVFRVDVDMCQYGVPWRQATAFIFWGV